MMEGRLGIVKRQEDSHRKFMYIMNEVAKHRQDDLKHYIDKERREEIQRKNKSANRVRKKAIQRHVLGKCLELNREDTFESPTGNMYGHYNGRPIESFSSDIQNYIASKDPKVKKQKDMAFVMKKYKDSGKILENDQMKDKVKYYFQTRWGVQYKDKEKDEPMPEKEEPQIRVINTKLPDIFSFYKTSDKPKFKSSERRMSRIEIRDESGQFVPLESVNALKGPRKSIFPPVENLNRRRSTIRRPSELKQFPSETLRKRHTLPPIK